MTETAINVELMLRELNYITDNPDKYDQRYWCRVIPPAGTGATRSDHHTCRTVGCFAGNVVVNAGKVAYFVWGRFSDYYNSTETEYFTNWDDIPDDTYLYDIEVQPNDLGNTWTDEACNILGLDYYKHQEIFDGDNTLWDVWNFARIFTRDQIQIPERVPQVSTRTREVFQDAIDDLGFDEVLPFPAGINPEVEWL